MRLGSLFLLASLLLPPLVVVVAAKDAFRLPKTLLSGWLALASLAALAWGLRQAGRVEWRALFTPPVVRALLPMLLVASLGVLTTRAPVPVREGLCELWIGALALAGWSLALDGAKLRRALAWLGVPAVLLVIGGVIQYLDLWEPLRFAEVDEASRLGVTSLAGNPGDLGAYLVLPALLALAALLVPRGEGRSRRLRGWRSWGALVVLVACLLGLAVTQSLTPIAAMIGGALVLALGLLPRRRLLPALAVGAVVLGLLVAGVKPLRELVVEKVEDVREGEWNRLLTGRLDGWWAASRMLRDHPLTGVGHGAYRSAFGDARLALVDEGVRFYSGQQYPVFANAHNEYLEVAAEWGWPGVLALAWGLWVLVGQARRIPAGEGDHALAWAGLTALGIQALTYFPFRVALVAFPWLVFLAWIFRRAREAAALVEGEGA